MLSQQQLTQHRLGRSPTRPLLGLLVLLALWHQCRAMGLGDVRACVEDKIPTDCKGNVYYTNYNGCPTYFCRRQIGEQCSEIGVTAVCEKSLKCSHGECMNCMDDKCYVELHAVDINFTKRLPNRQLPWLKRGRWPNLAPKLIEPNYDD